MPVIVTKFRSSSLSSLGSARSHPESIETLTALNLSPGQKLKSMSTDAPSIATLFYDPGRLETPATANWKGPASGSATLARSKPNPYLSLKKIMTLEQSRKDLSQVGLSRDGQVSMSKVKGISKH